MIGNYFDTDLIEQEEQRATVPYSFRTLNNLTNGGSCMGDLVVIVGDTGLGKSTLATQIIGDYWHKQGYKTCIYSGEMSVASVVKDLSIQQDFVGKDSNCYIASVMDLDDIETMAKDNGFKVFLVDNLMTLCSFSSDLYMEQSRAVKRLKEIASTYECLIILVCHPNKTKAARAENGDLTIESISGSSNIGNLANLILAFNRGEDNERTLEVLKNRKTGQLGKLYLSYLKTNKTYIEE